MSTRLLSPYDTLRFESYRHPREIDEALFRECLKKCTFAFEGKAGLMMCYILAERLDGDVENVNPVVIAFVNDKPIGWVFYDRSCMVEMYVQRRFRHRGVAADMIIILAKILNVGIRNLQVYNMDAQKAVNRASDTYKQTKLAPVNTVLPSGVTR